MDRVLVEIKGQSFLSPSQQPYFLSRPPPSPISNLQSSDFNLNNKVSPSILLIIVILAIIFFVSGLLHLLVRLFLRPPNRDPDDLDNATALQGQLQQLFHCHDAGVDQSFIDTFPVFHYKAIIGLKNPFDCAVCLCEFKDEDKLRLLPQCSHAFHMDCIDTWLLSHSTCPLCRANLLLEFSPNICSPLVLVLESGSESSAEIVNTTNSAARANSHLGFHCEDEFGSSCIDLSHISCKIQAQDDTNRQTMVVSEEKVVPVKLGKFRNVDNGGESCSNNNVDARRCFSMGSFQYVMDENSSLQVPIRTPMKKQSSKKPPLPLTPGHRPAMSECDCFSKREFNGFEPFESVEIQGGAVGSSRIISNGNGNSNSNVIGRIKRESFSVSKIWLRGRKDKPNAMAVETSRCAFSFRFPMHRNVVAAGDDLKIKNNGGDKGGVSSEMGIGRMENGENELGCDEEIHSCNSLDSQLWHASE